MRYEMLIVRSHLSLGEMENSFATYANINIDRVLETIIDK